MGTVKHLCMADVWALLSDLGFFYVCHSAGLGECMYLLLIS